jgi:hypothetical protein
MRGSGKQAGACGPQRNCVGKLCGPVAAVAAAFAARLPIERWDAARVRRLLRGAGTVYTAFRLLSNDWDLMAHRAANQAPVRCAEPADRAEP